MSKVGRTGVSASRAMAATARQWWVKTTGGPCSAVVHSERAARTERAAAGWWAEARNTRYSSRTSEERVWCEWVPATHQR
jgi:hypothetical protein